jgi:hypothetical protein
MPLDHRSTRWSRRAWSPVDGGGVSERACDRLAGRASLKRFNEFHAPQATH